MRNHTVRLDDDMCRELDALAERHRRDRGGLFTRATVIRELLREGLDRALPKKKRAAQ